MKFCMHMARVAAIFGTVTLAACGGSASTPGGVEVDWLTNVQEALQTGLNKNRVIFVAFVGSDWSVASQAAMTDVLNTETFKTFSDNNLVLLRLDFPRDKSKVPANVAANNADWAQKAQVDAFPSFAMVDPRGNAPTLFWKIGGYGGGGPDAFVQMVTQAIIQRMQTVAQQGLQGPAPGQQPSLAGPTLRPGQAQGVNGMPTPQDILRAQTPAASPLPAALTTPGVGSPNIPSPDQLMEQMHPTAPQAGPGLSGMPTPADLMGQVAQPPAPKGTSPTAPAQPGPPGNSASPADTTKLLFNLK